MADLYDTPYVRQLKKELAEASNTELLQRLAGYKPGNEYHLIVQAEIDRRKQVAKDQREDDRFRKTEFRSWLSVVISVLALAVALAVALYK